MNPDLLAEVAARFPLTDTPIADQDAMRALADQITGLAGGDSDTTFTAGVAQTLRWLADGTTTSESLAVVISATDAP